MADKRTCQWCQRTYEYKGGLFDVLDGYQDRRFCSRKCEYEAKRAEKEEGR